LTFQSPAGTIPKRRRTPRTLHPKDGPGPDPLSSRISTARTKPWRNECVFDSHILTFTEYPTGGGKMAEGKKNGFPFVLVGIGLGALYWFVDSLLNMFLTDNLNFFDHMLTPDLSSLYRRLVVISLLVLFGSHCQSKMKIVQEEVQEWMAYSQHLEEGGTPDNPE
jgi:hypothetical protein